MFSLMGNCCSCIRRKRQPIRSITLAILGLDSAGKSTTTKALIGDELDTAPTVGFNKEEFDFANYAIVMYDLGGGKKIRDIWKDYLNEIYGVVYVIDSSVRERMEEVKENLWSLIGHEMVKTKPLLILANKEDIQGHMDEVDMMESLEIEDLVNTNKCPCKMVMCSAIKGSGKKMDPNLKEGMTWLCSVLDQVYETLKIRVEQDMEVVELKRQKEREERRERVKKQREERERLQEEEDKKLGIKKEEEEDDDDIDIVDGADPFKRLTAEEIQKKDEKSRLAKEKEKERKKRLKELEGQEKENSGFTPDNNVNLSNKVDDQDDDMMVPRSSRSLGSYGLWNGAPLGRKKLTQGSDEDGDSDATMPRSGRQLLPPLQSPLGTKFMDGNNTNANKDRKKKKKLKQKGVTIEEHEESSKDTLDNHVYEYDNYGHSTMSVSKIAVLSKNDDSDNSDKTVESDRNLGGKDKYFKNTSPTPMDSSRKKKGRNKSHDLNDEDGFDTLRLSQQLDNEDDDSHYSISPIQKKSLTKNDYNSDRSITPVKKLKKKNKHLRKNKLAPSDDEYELSDVVQSPKKEPLPWARSQSPIKMLNTIPDDQEKDNRWGFAEDLAAMDGNQSMRRSRPNFDNDDLIL